MNHLRATLRKIAASDRQGADAFNRDHLQELLQKGYAYYDGYGYVKLTKSGRRAVMVRDAPGRKSQVLVPLRIADDTLARYGLTPNDWRALVMEVAC